WAVRRGNSETAVPRLLAMLSVLAVFIPSFFMQGSAKGLFVPLSLAVGFAMIASYLLSSTFVPVMSVWLLRGGKDGERGREGEGQPANSVSPSPPLPLSLALFGRLLRATTTLRWLIVPAYLAGA